MFVWFSCFCLLHILQSSSLWQSVCQPSVLHRDPCRATKQSRGRRLLSCVCWPLACHGQLSIGHGLHLLGAVRKSADGGIWHAGPLLGIASQLVRRTDHNKHSCSDCLPMTHVVADFSSNGKEFAWPGQQDDRQSRADQREAVASLQL